MKVQICQSDKICFYVEAPEPVFLLNGQEVVCENATAAKKDHFDSEVVQKLVAVICKKVDQLQTMVDFFQVTLEQSQPSFAVDQPFCRLPLPTFVQLQSQNDLFWPPLHFHRPPLDH